MSFNPEKISNFPTAPGVYLMKNQADEVIYVGKAVNLRQRVRQYFLPRGDGRVMVPFLITHVAAIDTVIVHSEKEALLLENNLIKKHKPKYNALLKDDKTYIALKINNRHPWPMIQLFRYKGKPKADGLYFGPYTSAFAARGTYDLLQRLYPLRQCSDQEFARRTRPCILYDMKKCSAPCVELISKEDYHHMIDNVIDFLKGRDKKVIKDLQADMEKAVENLDFERAGAILAGIHQIEATIETQKVHKLLGADSDILATYRQGDEVILSQLQVRGGKLTGYHNYNFSKIAEDDKELLESFLLQHYQNQEELPHEILLPEVVNGEAISEIISTNSKRTVQVLTPQKGEKKEYVEMARKNAEAAFNKEKDAKAIRERTLNEMQTKFHLKRFPERIECFDNSNLSGDEPVSALAAFTFGLKDSSRYRKYKIKTAAASDDYGAMFEVLSRRYVRAKQEDDLPDLIIVDGGKGHLNMALKVLHDLDIISVDVISIAKDEGRHDKGITSEQIFLPEIKDPIILPKNSPLLFLLQQIRDEAHRFAITFNRNRRAKKIIRTALGDIPGIGPTKQKALLKHFGSLKRVSEATPEQLAEVKGINQANIKEIQNHFNKKS